MLILLIWWTGLVFGALLLFRSILCRTFRTYSHFYLYIAAVFVLQPALYYVYVKHPQAYAQWFWVHEIVTMTLGCGIILEIFRHVLAHYPGAERFTRIAGLLVFGVIFGSVLLYPKMVQGHSIASSLNALDRDLRTVQAIFLSGILALISYYRIPLGRNIKGMIAGYGLYVGSALTNMTLRSYGDAFVKSVWGSIQPFSFDIALAVWLWALWVYQPNPAPERPPQLADDYNLLAARTRHALAGMRSQFARAARP